MKPYKNMNVGCLLSPLYNKSLSATTSFGLSILKECFRFFVKRQHKHGLSTHYIVDNVQKGHGKSDYHFLITINHKDNKLLTFTNLIVLCSASLNCTLFIFFVLKCQIYMFTVVTAFLNC